MHILAVEIPDLDNHNNFFLKIIQIIWIFWVILNYIQKFKINISKIYLYIYSANSIYGALLNNIQVIQNTYTFLIARQGTRIGYFGLIWVHRRG